MKPLRFIHAADLHLDSPFKGLSGMPELLRERIRESTFLALKELIQLAVREKVDFVLISGDVYELADRSLRAQIRFQRALEQLAALDISVYVIHGNHDPEDGRAAKLAWPAAVHFFASDRVETVTVEKPGRGAIAQIHGISYKTAAITENLALQFRKGELEMYQIGLLHTNVDGDAGHDNYAPCTKQDLLRSGMDYWALGHVHTRKVLNENPAIVYPGNIQGRSRCETGPRGCYLVEVKEKGQAELIFHALDNVRWFQERIPVAGIQTEQQLRELLAQHQERIQLEAGGRGALVRFILEGRSAVHGLLRKGKALEELLAELREEETERFRESLEIGGRELGADSVEWGSTGSKPTREDGFAWRIREASYLDASRRGFVWVESIEDHTGSELDLEALQQQKSFAGDLLRLSRSLLHDEAALRAFADEALAALQALPQAAGTAAAEPERLQLWLRAAEELAADLLAADGGWDG
jgi:exonuclease SbcD